ncbi:MAG: anthranilate phosphoribosyltransferase [Phycisphaeraceae bacterium]|nr:anthranilate phosphoribosyltransferase [Phycisphaeraceae bacterium]
MLSATLDQLLRRESLSEAQASDLLRALATEDIEPAIAGALLAALRAKGETPEEVRGFARAMRDLAVRPALPEDLRSRACDLVGTGGDGSHTFNVSTGAALLAAACGLPVVKHGNRSISSKSGAADLLEQLGLPVPLRDGSQGECLTRTNFCFLFAPAYHPAAARVAPVRRALGVRTVFNMLGPLTNPAQPPFGVIGAFSLDAARLMADAISGLPIERVFVVHGAPAWDEPTPVGEFHLFDVRPGRVRHEARDPSTVGLSRCAEADLKGGDSSHNADALRRVFHGEKSAHRDAVCLSCALALEASGVANSLREGIDIARSSLDDGRAARLLDTLAGVGRDAKGDAA